jgi:hypothetical protein
MLNRPQAPVPTSPGIAQAPVQTGTRGDRQACQQLREDQFILAKLPLRDWGSSPTTLRECDPSSRKQPTLPKPAASLPQPQQSRVLQENLVPQLLAPGASARGGPAG